MGAFADTDLTRQLQLVGGVGRENTLTMVATRQQVDNKLLGLSG